MRHARWTPAFGLFLALATIPGGGEADQSLSIKGRWLGQDRHDYCGAEGNSIQPNGVQDIHIALSGLPPRREIVSAAITGHGSDEWQYRGVQNQFGAVLLRKPGATTADVFFEPNHAETGRTFCVKLKFDDGSVVDVYLKGGKAGVDLRMPDAAMAVKWVGQDRQDQAGAGPGVGPDGVQDVRIAISKLSQKDRLASILVEDASGVRWAFGPNPEGHHNAEFLPLEKDPTAGNLFFHPDRDLAGRRLTVTVTYANGKKDKATVAAGHTDPKLAMPTASLPRISSLTVKSRWLGQDGSAVTGAGEVHVALTGLPATRPIAAAVLSDSVRGVWAFRAGDRPALDVEEGAAPLGFRRGAARSTADLFFAPIRDESNATMTLRLVFQDGESAVASFAGGPCAPSLRAPPVDPSEALAKPGDDLNDLASRHGTVRLTKGEYRLNRPLVLHKPVSVVGEPGAVLLFAQGVGDAPWTTAIKIHAGNTTLRGFGVRFAGPIRWRNEVSWSPAVIGTTDNLDTVPNLPKVNLTFEGLDLEGPQKSGKDAWEEAPKLMRLVNASNGRIVKNVLRGGLVELFGGPWRFEENDYRGTPPGTFTHGVLAVHDPHDLVVSNNRAKPVGPSGKTWRFLILTQRGSNDRVENNVVEGVGPRDDDTIPSANAPEIVLTESYHLWFEGKPAAVSADGRVVKVGHLLETPARTGDIVSALSGPGAGKWRRIAQRLEPTVYLLDAPLPRGSAVVAISPGFAHEVFSGNTIDAKGGRAAGGFVLAGNHFGTVVRNNRIVGAGEPLLIMAYPSETPRLWGWSHAPFLGGLIEGNTLEDSERGAVIGVNHGGITKSNKGRVYMTLSLRGNTVRWSEPFLSRLSQSPLKRPAAGITLGYAQSLDPGELVVDEKDNRLVAPAGTPASSALKVNAAILNGRSVTNRAFTLPSAAEPLSTGRNDSRPRAGLPRR